jgi:hypothetical protein
VTEPEIAQRCRDWVGAEVVLDVERLKHIEEGHPELKGHELAIMTAIERADRVKEGNFAGSKKVSSENLGPSKWLTVVIDYSRNPARVITAYPQARLKD